MRPIGFSFFTAPKHWHCPCGPLSPGPLPQGGREHTALMRHRRGRIRGGGIKDQRVVIAPYGRLIAAPSGSGRGNALVFHPTG
jgi:hypothetical protein